MGSFPVAERDMKLPELVKMEDYNGDANKYIEALYAFFKQDFIKSKPIYKNIEVNIIKEPKLKDKEWTFWHITSEGKKEEERIPDIRKCEKIRWIKPIIESTDNGEIKFWRNERGKDKRICLCYGDWEYIVILIDRKKYILLCTAYPVERDHTKTKLQKECDDFEKANTTL